MRFFARLRSAVLECPGGCGRLYDLRSARGVGQQAGQLSRRYWDPLSGRFECPGCGKVYQLGIVAYSLPGKASGLIPADWRPTLPQAVWMRDQARGKVETLRSEQGANRIEGADWADPAELGTEIPPAQQVKRGAPPLGGRPGVRSAPAAPTYGSTWRKPRGQAIGAPPPANEANEEDYDDGSD